MTKQKKLIIIGVIVALLLAAGGYWYQNHRYLDLNVNSSVDQGYVPAGGIDLH